MTFYRSQIFIVAAAIVAVIPLALGPSSDADLDSFPSATETVAGAEVIRHVEGRTDYFDLVVTGASSARYYLRQPEPENLRRYHAAIPIGGTVVLHYEDGFEGKLIYDARTADRVIIPLEQMLREKADSRRQILNWAALFGALGIVGWIWEHRRAKRARLAAPAK